MNEFIINLGSKATRDAPITANFLATNFLHRKYTGIIIKIDINTESDLWICISVKTSLESNTVKKALTKIGQPLFAGVQLFGNSPIW